MISFRKFKGRKGIIAGEREIEEDALQCFIYKERGKKNDLHEVLESRDAVLFKE